MRTVFLLLLSNIFMTFAWYGHLKNTEIPLWKAILISWGIAFFEYCFQVPANRIGNLNGVDASKLKILQEVITLSVFVPFSVYFLRQPLKLDYLWAGLCICGAVYFIFRS